MACLVAEQVEKVNPDQWPVTSKASRIPGALRRGERDVAQ